MITLKTDCNTCIHKDICRYKDNAKYDMNKLRDMNYGEGSNDDYDWETMSNSHHVNIDISCKDFEKIRPVVRTMTSKELEYSQHDK